MSRAAIPSPTRKWNVWTTWDIWAKLALFMMLGYSLFGRSFAYLGIPPAHIFIGDVTLLAFILLRPRQFFDPWINGLSKGGPLSPFCWVLFLSILYGFFEVFRGIGNGYPPLTAIEELVFNIYPLYLFVGLWIGARHPEFFRKWIHVLAWTFCFYGPIYLVYLHSVPVFIPGATDKIQIFGQPSSGGPIILGLLCLELKPVRYWLPMVVAALMLLVMQVRADWLAFALGITIWGVLARKLNRVALIGLVIVVLLAIGFVADIDLPSPAGRGGAISSREIVARGLAAVSPNLAEEYTSSENASFYAGTIKWRTEWWHAIWVQSQDNDTMLTIGPGYGFPLKSLLEYLKGQNKDLRTPHNIFFFSLGYTGWIGVVLFFSIQISCFFMLWRVYRDTGELFGLVLWAGFLVSAFFEDSLETPFFAIPFYLVVGVAIGPYLQSLAHRVRRRRLRTEPIAPIYVSKGI